ncbi:hypothetical protein PInf_021945 [Phytophthora infestans]|nr:hypothetical protein PInf_021945 [Phytophthora infestans]
MKKKPSIIRQMSRLFPKASTEVVKLSYWVFAVCHVWLHCIIRLQLQDTFLNLYLESYEIGLPSPYHNTIANVHMIMSVLHGACIVLMLGGSIYQRSLAFTPWASCDADAKLEETKSDRTSSVILQSFSKIDHFHEVVETALQTVQAYRMSQLLPRTLLNRFYAVLLAVNCWSSVIVYSFFFKKDEARRRLACIVSDCVLDFMSCMGVELIVLLSYAGDYDTSILGFPEIMWYNDEWNARALNELKMVLVVSWTDLASRSIFSLGLILTTMSMKELLARLPRRKNQVSQFGDVKTKGNARTESDTFWDAKLNAVAPKTFAPSLPIPERPKRSILLLIRHCPELEMPDFPQTLYDLEFCVTNLRTLPDDLDAI